jgi:D-glycero-D-manno-heptose 1,7-bisphosphate phosphatase
MNQRFVILDRDGTIIVDRNYLSDHDGVELLPSAASGLQKIQALGLRLVLITNQSGVGRGFFSMKDVDALHQRMTTFLEEHDIKLEGIFVCPHTPGDGCECRKPQPGLARLAADHLGISLADSFVIGDKACDIQLGHNIGATTFLVRTGYGDNEARNGRCKPHFIVTDLLEAAQLIENWM